jgi:hypothetical protein
MFLYFALSTMGVQDTRRLTRGVKPGRQNEKQVGAGFIFF